MRGAVLAAMLLLGACDQPQPSTEAQAYDAARDVTQPKFDELQDKIANLETQVHQQRAEIDGLESDEAGLRAAEKVDDSNIKTAFDNHNKLLNAYKEHLRAYHGVNVN